MLPCVFRVKRDKCYSLEMLVGIWEPPLWSKCNFLGGKGDDAFLLKFKDSLYVS